jgi:hypothetical protein
MRASVEEGMARAEQRSGAEEGKRRREEEGRRKRKKEKGEGITSALIAERRSRVVDRPPSSAGWDSGQVRCRSSGWRGKTERVRARVLTGFDDEQFLNETL